ncbi:MAG: PadR family transcriptional regulator [Asticcacaulis sp.]|nr:PadR family transcriptional regulator [Asticcacaulis sp.]
MTPLSYALLGLVRMQPRSGYALRKVFETTPLGGYSSSPGSIYPALKSLEKAGLLAILAPSGARGRGLYHLTAEGEGLLDAWLAAPVSDLGEAMLRFAFLRDDDRDAILAFLDAFQAAAENQSAGLEAFLANEGARDMPPKGRIAVQHGLCQLRASADWARWTRKQYLTDRGGTR